jgi:hypothetical protein
MCMALSQTGSAPSMYIYPKGTMMSDQTHESRALHAGTVCRQIIFCQILLHHIGGHTQTHGTPGGYSALYGSTAMVPIANIDNFTKVTNELHTSNIGKVSLRLCGCFLISMPEPLSNH